MIQLYAAEFLFRLPKWAPIAASVDGKRKSNLIIGIIARKFCIQPGI